MIVVRDNNSSASVKYLSAVRMNCITFLKCFAFGTVFLFSFYISPTLPAAPSRSAKDAVDSNSQIRPILSSKCYHCHGPDDGSRKAKLRLDQREEATKGRKGGTFAIKPGDLQHSELVRRTSSKDP